MKISGNRYLSTCIHTDIFPIGGQDYLTVPIQNPMPYQYRGLSVTVIGQLGFIIQISVHHRR